MPQKSFDRARVLITGGLGFIGSNLAHSLVEQGAEVILVDSMIPSYGARLFNIESIRDRVRLNISDIREPFSIDQLVVDQDYIFCLAGQLSHIDSMRQPFNDLDINCRGQLNILESCRKHNPKARLILSSTRQVYGRPRYLPVDEAHPIEPVDINGVHKWAAEQYFQLYHKVYGLSTIVLRLTNTYGPRMDLLSNDKGFAAIFVRKALLGEKIQLFGGGEQRRDFNYISDVVSALEKAALSPLSGRSFHLAHHRAHSLREFVSLLQAELTFPLESIPFPLERQSIDIGDYYGSYAQFQEASGWRPLVDLEEGLRETLAFYQAHRLGYLPAALENPERI